MNTFSELSQALQDKDDFILTGHEHPDPDSIGSMLGLYFGLSKLGKKCRLVSADPPPSGLSWSGLERIEILDSQFEPGESCVLVLDCEPHRTGAIAPGVERARCLINIDHHERERGPGQIVYVDPQEAATSVIVYRLLEDLDIPLDLEIATALYGGIVGDTGGFRHANTNSEVLTIGAELLSFGVKPAQVAREIFSSLPWGFLKLLGSALTNLKKTAQGRLVWMEIDYEELKRYGPAAEQTDHLISYARMVETAEIAIVFRETKPGEIRLGFRANSIDVGRLARHFGGGGHKLASGAAVQGNLDEIVHKVITTAESYLTTGEIDGRDS